MASSTSRNISNLVINKVPSQTVFNTMLSAGQVNSDELYLIEDGALTVLNSGVTGKSLLNSTSTNLAQNEVIDTALNNEANSDIILVQSSQPSSSTCKLWVQI